MSGPDFDSNTGCYTVSLGEGGRRHGNFVLVGGTACCNPTHTQDTCGHQDLLLYPCCVYMHGIIRHLKDVFHSLYSQSTIASKASGSCQL